MLGCSPNDMPCPMHCPVLGATPFSTPRLTIPQLDPCLPHPYSILMSVAHPYSILMSVAHLAIPCDPACQLLHSGSMVGLAYMDITPGHIPIYGHVGWVPCCPSQSCRPTPPPGNSWFVHPWAHPWAHPCGHPWRGPTATWCRGSQQRPQRAQSQQLPGLSEGASQGVKGMRASRPNSRHQGHECGM